MKQDDAVSLSELQCVDLRREITLTIFEKPAEIVVRAGVEIGENLDHILDSKRGNLGVMSTLLLDLGLPRRFRCSPSW